jgi:6-phosphogluconate dehydrogenase
MERLLDHEPAQCAQRFAEWAESDMGSYLIEITAELLAVRDKLSGRPLLEVVSDRAGQKGTGQWTAAAALELGVAAPTLAEAVFARNLSALGEHRRSVAATRPPPTLLDMDAELGMALAPALDAATLCAYAQGFALIAAAASAEGWSTDLSEVARVWRAGCIIRSKALLEVGLAFREAPGLPTLLLDRGIAGRIARGALELRSVVSIGALHGVSLPCMASALAYYDAYGDTRLWTTLIQAQRDRFGAHGFERTDRPGKFHLDGSDA